jgi:hypothetical protein
MSADAVVSEVCFGVFLGVEVGQSLEHSFPGSVQDPGGEEVVSIIGVDLACCCSLAGSHEVDFMVCKVLPVRGSFKPLAEDNVRKDTDTREVREGLLFSSQVENVCKWLLKGLIELDESLQLVQF